jgi:hypothetical protein
MIWRVPRSWEGETCVILAGGPSLRGFGARALLRSVEPFPRVITINDSWRLAPWADVLYFCDRKWRDFQVSANRSSVDNSTDFAKLIYSGFWVAGNEAFNDHPHVHALKLTGQRGFDNDPGCLRHGSNSGYQAIHLAAHFGAKRIVLLGYDMHVEKARSHWHDEQRPTNFQQLCDQSFLPHFESLKEPLAAAGIEVINATPNSALKCWPYMPLKEALNRERRSAPESVVPFRDAA